MTEPENVTVYLALSRDSFYELIEETRDYLGHNEDPFSLLRRWLSLQTAGTELAIAVGTTKDTQAQVTALLSRIESLIESVNKLETEHVTWIGPNGTRLHPAWCRECRVTRVMNGVREALAELERHAEGAERPEMVNVCRRVIRYLTTFKNQPGAIEPENAGLQEIRALIGRFVKLGEDYDEHYPWVSTVDGVKAVLQDMASMQATIERRGERYQTAERKLAAAEQWIAELEKPRVVHVVCGGVNGVQYVASTEEKAREFCRNQGIEPDITTIVVDS